MKLNHYAIAGTLESSDIQVMVEPQISGRIIELESTVYAQYGPQIETTIHEVLDNLEIDGVKIIANDHGALDCTIRARVETALFRAADQHDNLPWGKKL